MVGAALGQIDRLARRWPLGFPSGYSRQSRYAQTVNTGWTPGFWAGLLWLAYQHTGDALWRVRAEALLPSFAARLDADGAGNATHDLGFLYSLSCVAAVQCTGSAYARQLAWRAADVLAARAHPRASVVQAWGELDDAAQRGRILIDSAMNMPLLCWAGRTRGGSDLHDLALRHWSLCARHLVRADGSTHHSAFIDTDTGACRSTQTLQGWSDASCWARGQAWALYGFTLAFRHSGRADFLALARRLAHRFLQRLPADGVCAWDLDLDPAQGHAPDSSASAIAAAGLLALAAQLPAPDADAAVFKQAGLRLLHTLGTRFRCHGPHEDGLLRGAVAHHPLGQGIGESCLWGDYFYLEALLLQRQVVPVASFWGGDAA